ncbi:MAG: hypothetical protein AB1585_15045 [Thermodesulfobacteriota bacterium]
MPRRDGTGPAGKGSGGGFGTGRGLGGGAGMGAGGNCVCPKCGNKKPHARGVPCNTFKCPHCGTSMVRE